MDKKDQLLQLIDHFSNGNKSSFAAMIGVTPQGLSTWLARGTFDIERIYSKCENISAEWLLTGEGDMLRCAPDESHVHAAPPPPLVGDMLDRITAQAAEIGRLEERIRQLERENDRLASDARASGVACAG